MLKVNIDYIPLYHPNRPGYKIIKPLARIWHGTANYSSGADDIMHSKYVKRSYTKKWNNSLKKYEYFESNGKPFLFGCTHVFIDKDSAVIVVPLDEYVPGAGDRPNPYDNGYKGQTKIAKDIFNHEQNYKAIQFELCMNDMSAWDKVLNNAIEFCVNYVPDSTLLNFRHFDVTGKLCPSPMINNNTFEVFQLMLKLKLMQKKYPIGTPIIRVNGTIINDLMDIQPFIKNGRTFVPIRFIAEALGKEVNWIESEKIIDIK